MPSLLALFDLLPVGYLSIFLLSYFFLSILLCLQVAVGFDPWAAGQQLRTTLMVTDLTSAEVTGVQVEEGSGLMASTKGGEEAKEAATDEQTLEARQMEMATSLVRHGKYSELEDFLRHPDTKLTTSSKDSAGNTLLHVACQNGNKRIAKLCLRLGSDIDGQNLNGQTALHYCFAYGFSDLGEYLVAKVCGPSPAASFLLLVVLTRCLFRGFRVLMIALRMPMVSHHMKACPSMMWRKFSAASQKAPCKECFCCSLLQFYPNCHVNTHAQLFCSAFLYVVIEDCILTTLRTLSFPYLFSMFSLPLPGLPPVQTLLFSRSAVYLAW